MKALSIWQPWASLIADGLKQFETRSWATQYRGPLLICSAKFKPPFALRRSVYSEHMKELIGIRHYFLKAPQAPFGLRDRSGVFDGKRWFDGLPSGNALCVVDIAGCLPVTDPAVMDATPHSSREFALGDFSPGRFAWILRNVRRFKEPWGVKGRQGLFDVSDDEIEKHELE